MQDVSCERGDVAFIPVGFISFFLYTYGTNPIKIKQIEGMPYEGVFA